MTQSRRDEFDPAHVSVLNVDDHEPARYAKSRILRHAGYGVIECAGGLEALRLARDAAPTVVLLDVNMPDMNGFDVCRALKSSASTAHIPVIQISASFVSAQDQVDGLDGGADAYLVTPTDSKVLLATVRAMARIRIAEKEREDLLLSEREARAHADRVGRMKDEFLATLSHELRTPLNAVMGWVTILKSKAPTPETLTEGLEVIDRNARRQAQLIADLLDMSRIISGKIRLTLQPIELAPIIHEALDAARPAAAAKDQRLTVTVGTDIPQLQGDPARLQQIVWNLASNAIKFTPRGGRIDITTARVHSHVEVHVRDNGQGISPDFLPHIFDRFRQADSSAARLHGGLGIGLAIVKQLVELHGGRVRATSEGENRGSLFTVELPIAAVSFISTPNDEPHSTGDAPSNGPQPMVTPELSGSRVLVIDDEPDARDLIRRVLSECGAAVTVAASAQEGLEAVKATPPDLIVSDIGLPRVDGYMFMNQLRSSRVTTPAIALTAFAREEDRQRVLAAGYQMHMAKPVEPAAFLLAVESLLKSRER